VLFQQQAQFILEGYPGVVLFLVVDVADARFDGRFADGEAGVAVLPMELGALGAESFKPFGGLFFGDLEEIGEGLGFGEQHEEVDVVLHAADADEFAAGVLDDAGHVGVELGLDGRRDEGEAVFGGENEVDVEFDEGLRHDGSPGNKGVTGGMIVEDGSVGNADG